MFTSNDIKYIERYCSGDLVKRINSLMDKLENNENNNVVKITNTGMVSSGKSSLFNVLINDDLETNDEDDYFKIGSARTTMSADRFFAETIEYVDTPGIDVKEEDDEIAYKTIMSSDIIMMIHNVKTGPLHRSEAEWLERIVSNIGDSKIVEKRLIFICSWKDAREKSEDYGDLIDDLQKTVFDICGTEIPFFKISVKEYLAGVEKNIEKLIVGSGINELKLYLNNYAKKYSTIKADLNKNELKKISTEIKNELNLVLSNKNNEVNNNRYKINDRFNSRRNVWDSIFQVFVQYCEQHSEMDNRHICESLKETGESWNEFLKNMNL